MHCWHSSQTFLNSHVFPLVTVYRIPYKKICEKLFTGGWTDFSMSNMPISRVTFPNGENYLFKIWGKLSPQRPLEWWPWGCTYSILYFDQGRRGPAVLTTSSLPKHPSVDKARNHTCSPTPLGSPTALRVHADCRFRFRTRGGLPSLTSPFIAARCVPSYARGWGTCGSLTGRV